MSVCKHWKTLYTTHFCPHFFLLAREQDEDESFLLLLTTTAELRYFDTQEGVVAFPCHRNGRTTAIFNLILNNFKVQSCKVHVLQ